MPVDRRSLRWRVNYFAPHASGASHHIPGCDRRGVVVAAIPINLARAPIDPNAKLQCISYAPFRNNQTSESPTPVPRDQIAEDLAQLAKITDCIRTYATDLGLDQIPELASKVGLKVIQGIWLDRDRRKSATQISTGIRLARQYPETITALVVGNEVCCIGR